MPINLNDYPDHWRQITHDLKEFHGWTCEECGKRHGEMAINSDGEPYIVVMTCSHVNHDIWNPYAELRVLCAACHLNYDRPLHIAHMIQTMRYNKLTVDLAAGQLVLFAEGLPPELLQQGDAQAEEERDDGIGTLACA